MPLTQVVPHLANPPEGVGTYAVALGVALRDRFGIATTLLVGDPTWNGAPETEGFAAGKVNGRDAEVLAMLPRGAKLLLHYVNYGYERRGCPVWLIEGLARWKRAEPERRLVTVFHEVYASGPPWRSSFWLGPRQRRLAARLLQLSDAAVTSLDRYACVLRRWRPEARIAVNPVFSTVGEPVSVAPLATRSRRLVLFGGHGTRSRAWGESRRELLAACRTLGVEEICDVGPPVGAPARLDGLPVRELGVLGSREASECLLESCAGFLTYPPDFLGKSTTFAAYCAHGLLPICAWSGTGHDPAADALPPHWRPRESAPADPQAVAAAAHTWYASHSLGRQVESFRELLQG